MSISETTVKCTHCRSLYKMYMHMVDDQSACPSCVAKAASNMRLTIHRFDNLIDSGSGKPFVIKSSSECDTSKAREAGCTAGQNILNHIGGGSSNKYPGVSYSGS